ncbi:hypothetical protein QTP86_030844 [Hemibagrus guttatus]|nr:hypothetical protein QTP86_030844 [Hemibagrus guttatus]
MYEQRGAAPVEGSQRSLQIRDNKEKSISTRPSADHQPFTLTSTDVYNVLSQINARKDAGPDGIPGCVLRACAEQLAGVFMNIFNLSLTHSVMPTCFKSTSIQFDRAETLLPKVPE